MRLLETNQPNLKNSLFGAIRLGIVLLFAEPALCQCSDLHQLTHTAGTQQVGCTEVTVEPYGGFEVGTFGCPNGYGYGPYWIGATGTSGVLFTFSNPITFAKFEIHHIDKVVVNGFPHEELVSFEVNGNFYPLTDAGTIPYCETHAVVSAPGVLRSPGGVVAGCHELIINGPITSLRIEDEWLVGTPVGITVNVFICCESCQTDAGQIPFNQVLHFCSTNDHAIVPSTVNPVLDPDDLLQYALCYDTNNIIFTIVATSSTPDFTFNPATMSPDIPYFIVAIAGNQLNGNVDLNDPCFDASNPIMVIWHSPPTVSFQLDIGCLLSGGCYEVDISFTGTPPFQLSAQAVMGNNVLATFGGSYNGDAGTYTLCLPANTPSGELVIEGVSLADAFCTCD